VIGPIGDRFAVPDSPARTTYEDALEVLERIIEPACEANGITAVRADQISASGDINEQVFRHLRDDDIVIADVSGGNANVMYELGARHTLNKLTIQLGEYGQLPFDIRTIRTIQFSRSRRGLIDARNELEQAIATGLAEGPEELPLYRVWQGGGESIYDAVAASPEKLLDASDDDTVLPLIDGVAAAELAFPQFTEVATKIAETMEEIGALAQDATEAANQANLKSATAAARLVIIGKFAKDLDGPTSELEELGTRYDELLAKIERAMFSIFANLDANPEQLADENVQNFLHQLTVLADSSREAMESVNSFSTSAEGMSGISKRLRVPGRRLVSTVRKMARATARIDEWDRRAKAYLNDNAAHE